MGDCMRFDDGGCQKTYLNTAETITLGVNWQWHFSATHRCTQNFDRRATLDLPHRQPKYIPSWGYCSDTCRGSTQVYKISLVLVRFGQACGVCRDLLQQYKNHNFKWGGYPHKMGRVSYFERLRSLSLLQEVWIAGIYAFLPNPR